MHVSDVERIVLRAQRLTKIEIYKDLLAYHEGRVSYFETKSTFSESSEEVRCGQLSVHEDAVGYFQDKLKELED